MSIQISLKKSTSAPTGSSGLTLGEPVFNYANSTLWVGMGGTTTPIWIGAGICGASAGIAAGLTYQIPTLGAVKDYFSAVSSAFLGTTAAYVSTFNGLTGAVQGVSAAVAGTGIAVSGSTGSVTITNIGVQSFNGLTGTVTGVTVGGANTFTALNTFNAGISSAGGTFSSLTRFTAGITTSFLYVSGGATFGVNTSTNGTVFAKSLAPYGGFGAATLYINADGDGNGGGNTVTVIGDSAAEGNNTYISVDDASGVITLNSGVGGINHSGSFNGQISAPSFADTYSFVQTYRTTTTATTANQTIATISNVYDDAEIPPVMGYPAFEVTISARDTVLNKTEMLKMLVVQDGTNTVNTQYGLIRTGATGPVSSYSTTLSGSPLSPKNLLIRATPLSANNTVFTTTVRAQNNG